MKKNSRPTENRTSEVEDAVVHLLRTSQSLDLAAYRGFAKMRLTPAAFNSLRVTAMHPGITQADAARLMVIDPSSVTGVFKSLEARGLIKRTADPKNVRRLQVRLTPEGERVYAEANVIYSRFLAEVKIPAADLASFRAQLQKIEAAATSIHKQIERGMLYPATVAVLTALCALPLSANLYSAYAEMGVEAPWLTAMLGALLK
jgi:DNA-binding MarR family transcriptional regulator